jgi:hypothetical protein
MGHPSRNQAIFVDYVSISSARLSWAFRIVISLMQSLAGTKLRDLPSKLALVEGYGMLEPG